MSLKPIVVEYAEFIDFVECDICCSRFAESVTWAWPFCAAGIPHERMESKEQIRRQKLLSETPEKATASYVMPMLKLYGPMTLSVKWQDGDLPNMPDLQTIVLRKEKFKEFSDFYRVMGVFVGNVLGKHDWAMIDLLNYSKRWL